MTRVVVSLCIASVLFCVGCGSSNNSSGPPPRGNYSNANLSGQYAYQITGFDLSNGNRYTEGGVFTADGNGHITAGTDDFSEGSPVPPTTLSGTYSISNDGTGSAVLSFANGSSLSLVLTLASSSKVNLISAPLTTSFFASGAGVAEKQDSTAFAAAPTGTFVFKWHSGSTTTNPVTNIGAFTLNTGTLTAGNKDTLSFGSALSSATFASGQLSAPDTGSGRGTGSLTDSNGATSTFVYYVVNPSNLRFFMTNSPGTGTAERQTLSSFNPASFSGGYAFGGVGDTATFFSGANTVGVVTADGNGNITAGAYDAVQDGTTTSNAALSGTYTVASSGRVPVSLNAGAIRAIFWLVSPSRAFFLIDDPTKVEDGTADHQSGSFAKSTLNGQFSLVMDGSDTAATVHTYDRVGTLQWNGIGGLGLTEAINFAGTTTTPGFLTGSYDVASNGRATGSIASLSSNLVFYLVSGSSAYVLQEDGGIEVSGTISLQQP
jgi:hypothetical protein